MMRLGLGFRMVETPSRYLVPIKEYSKRDSLVFARKWAIVCESSLGIIRTIFGFDRFLVVKPSQRFSTNYWLEISYIPPGQTVEMFDIYLKILLKLSFLFQYLEVKNNERGLC